MSAAPESAVAAGKGKESASASSQVEPPPWESPQWPEALSQNPGVAPFFDNLESFVELPEGVEKLRALVLGLAINGTLVEQDPSDEPASELLGRIVNEKAKLVEMGLLRKSKPLAPIIDKPYEIPISWTWTRLGNVQIYTNGYAFKSTEYQDDGIGIVRIGDIQDGQISTNGMKFVPASYTEELDQRLQVRPGDLLIAMSGATTGKLGFNKTENTFLLNQRVGKIELIQVDPQFACFFLTTKVQENLRKSAGSAIPNLSTTQVNDLEFPLPPLAEQRRIVSKVEGLMSLCDTLESQRRSRESVRERASRSVLASLTSASAPLPTGTSTGETLNSSWQRLSDHFEVLLDQPSGPAHLRQSILQLASTGKLRQRNDGDQDVAGAIRRVEIEREEQISNGILRKEKPFELVEDATLICPDGWAKCPIGDIANCLDHIRKPVKKADRELRGGEIPYYGANGPVGTIDEFLFDEPLVLVVEDESFEGRKKPFSYRINGKAWVNNHAHVLQPTSAIDVDYLNIALSYYPFTKYTSGTTNRKKLTRRGLLHAPFLLPPLAEQKRIVSKVSVLLSQLDELSARLRERQSTTQQLLTATIHHILDEGKP